MTKNVNICIYIFVLVCSATAYVAASLASCVSFILTYWREMTNVYAAERSTDMYIHTNIYANMY